MRQSISKFNHMRMLLATIALIILSPLGGIMVAAPEVLVGPWLILLSIVAFSILLVFVYSKSRPVDPFEPIWFFLFNATLTLRFPVTMFFTGNYQSRFVRGSDAKAEALVIESTAILVLAYVVMVIGYYAPFGYRLAKRGPQLANRWFRERAIIAGIGITLIALLSYLILLSRVGGIELLIQKMAFRSSLLIGSAYLQLASQLILIPLCIAFVMVRRPARNFVFWGLFVSAIIMNFSFGSRTNVLFWVLVPVMIIYHYYHRRLSMKWLLIALPIVIVVSAVMFEIRSFGQRQAEVTAALVWENVTTGAIVGDFFDERSVFFDMQVWIIDNVPEQFSPWWGKTYFNLFVAPIPRSLWPDKPEGFIEGGILGRMILGKKYYGLPPDLPGLFYLHFLLPGVMIGMFAVGVVHRGVWEYFKQHSNNVAIIILYPILWNSAGSIFSVGGLVKVLPFLVVCLITLRYITGTSKAYRATHEMPPVIQDSNLKQGGIL